MQGEFDHFTPEQFLPDVEKLLGAGLTGYAQIMGKYNTTSKDKLILDLMYIENFSLWNDIKIIFQTILVLFKASDSTEAFSEEDERHQHEEKV